MTSWRPLCVFLFVFLIAATLDAHPPYRPPPRFTVTLADEGGQPMRTFYHRGVTYVLGERDRRYSIVVHNPTPRRVEAVITVDGRDVVSGRRGDFVHERGYVIAPYGSVRVSGFRQSLSRVAAFRFGSPYESYSARMGTPENVGVVGVALFSEAVPQRYEEDLGKPSGRSQPTKTPRPRNPNPRAGATMKRRSAGSQSSARRDEAARPSPYAPRGNLGTRYGESRMSSAYEVSFSRRGASPDALITLHYDDEAGLRARGIFVDRWPDWRRMYHPDGEPAPFPNNRFAPPPP